VLTLPRGRVESLLAFLEGDAGFSAAASGELVSSYPSLLTYSVDREVRPLVGFLRAHGVDPSAEACRPL